MAQLPKIRMKKILHVSAILLVHISVLYLLCYPAARATSEKIKKFELDYQRLQSIYLASIVQFSSTDQRWIKKDTFGGVDWTLQSEAIDLEMVGYTDAEGRLIDAFYLEASPGGDFTLTSLQREDFAFGEWADQVSLKSDLFISQFEILGWDIEGILLSLRTLSPQGLV